jgi:hypothetical protein
MDAYVIGRHDDAPAQLASASPQGNRIRAIARGEEGLVLIAIEHESDDDLDRHVEAIRSAGVDVRDVLRHHPGGPDAENIGPIIVPPPPPPPMPQWIPPLPWLLFVLGRLERVDVLVSALREDIDADSVAWALLADGRSLIEIGGDDRASLDASFARAAEAAELDEHLRLYVSSERLTRP